MIGSSIIGCSDLKEEPIGLLSPEGFFKTTGDIQIAVDGSLTHAINEEVWGRKLSCALLLRSDMSILNSTETRRLEMDQHSITGDNEMVYDPWKRMYQGIAAANVAIAGANDVDVAEQVKNPVTAQAYFVRAWYYFHLVRLFGDIPYISEPISDLEAASSISTTSEADVYKNIIADLEFAKEWLPDNSASAAIPDKAAAGSYLALVYLTKSDYANAWAEAKEVIDNAGAYGLALDPDFQTLFNARKIDASPEPIFALDYNNVQADDNAYDQIAPMTSPRGLDVEGGWSVISPTMEVFNSFDDADYRKRVSFRTRGVMSGTEVDYTTFGDYTTHIAGNNRPYIAKYERFPGDFARGSKRATSHNYSMLRYAELLLIAAEAAVELNDNPSALMYMNMVRERARQGGESTNGGDVLETIAPSAVPADFVGTVTVADVLEERRIELAFEMKRWYDIKRRQLGDVVFGAGGYEGAKSEWNASEDYDTPIPQDEIDANPNLGL